MNNKKLALLLTSIAVLLVIAYVVSGILVGIAKRQGINEVIQDKDTYLVTLSTIALLIVSALVFIRKYKGKGTRDFLSTKNLDGVKANLENARFLTDNEVDEIFTSSSYKNLEKVKSVGIPIKAEYKDEDIHINFAKPAHTLILGTTGSGKTSSFISPTIEILSLIKAKPSLFIADPKGELFKTHAGALKKRGYKIKVIDLRNPYSSIRWNPMVRAWDMKQEILHVKDKVKMDEEKGIYSFNDVKYPSKEAMEEQVLAYCQRLEDEIYETLHDIVMAIYPRNSSMGDPIWDNGAQNMILAIALAMLEDAEVEGLHITREKYNFYNLTKIANSTDKNCAELKKYFENRDATSKAFSLSRQVLGAPEKMMGSFTSTMQNALSMFSDLSICALTSQDEADFIGMADTPTAYFLQIPDEKATRHPLASLIVLQAYKDLVSRANKEANLALPRDVFFLLDEFGNLPKISKIEQMITVGRSRKIWFSMVIQSYAQLKNVYGITSADIIKSNCNIHVFIGTSDLDTTEEFSKKCGNYTVTSVNVSMDSSNEDTPSTSTHLTQRPLIYPSELRELNKDGDMGHAIITVFGFQPIKSTFTPIYQCPLYSIGNAKVKNHEMHPFNEREIMYNWPKRYLETQIKKTTRGRRKNMFDKRREDIKFHLTENFKHLWDATALYKYENAEHIGEEYQAIKSQARYFIKEYNKHTLFARYLERAIEIYEKEFGVSDIGITIRDGLPIH